MAKCKVPKNLHNIPLKSGVLAMGYIKAVLSITYLSFFLIMADGLVPQTEKTQEPPSIFDKDRIKRSSFDYKLSPLFIVCAVIVIKMLSDTLFALILLYGGHKGNSRYISVCYNYSLVSLVLWFPTATAGSFLNMDLALILIIWSGVEIYFVIVIRNYLRAIKTQDMVENLLNENVSEDLEEEL